MEAILQTIGVKNLRSIYMAKPVKLTPITILVGRNSAGKSTFARTFPLLRQSCEAKTRAPILWFGDRTDFGSFKESIRKGNGVDNIEFNFSLMIPTGALVKSRGLSTPTESGSFIAELSFTIKSAAQGRSFSPLIRIKALGFDMEIKINELNNLESITCSGRQWKPHVSDYSDISYQSILPRLTILRESKPKDKKSVYEEFVPFHDEIASQLAVLGIQGAERIINALPLIPLFNRGGLRRTVSPWMSHAIRDLDPESVERLYAFLDASEATIFGSKVNELLTAIDSALKEYFAGVRYIEPLRATAQRYYRKQELAIDEIDSKGENLAMYLDSLGPWQTAEFSNWTQENFGFAAKTQSEGGHVAIVVSEQGKNVETNLADIGFGFSQILPVIVQIWMSMRPVVLRGKGTSCIVIEQPELHLHPALQAKLADVFAAVPRSNSTVQLLIETHSNHLINRFGQLISEGALNSSDIQILIIDKDEKGDRSTITESGYDEEGYLLNWPVGFFEPEF